ncbi:RHS repeat-associated core domain-containing protein [Horticoccus sp. 23ND18S-11]|uniref:RHS repeat-associated core domain-containing protein n=1 Tax=Horticoccus sp. 23ND18S-11 TaxID=3391832 RepID=UPI0039C9ADC8
MNTLRLSIAAFAAFLGTFVSDRALAQSPVGNPATVPLKVWVVGEVASPDSGGTPWRMTLGGDFTPTQPGMPAPEDVSVQGGDPSLTEKLVTLNGVPCEPFREYTLAFWSQGFWSGRFCVAAPPGYRVEIDRQPRNSILFDNSGGSIVWDAHPTVRIVPTSDEPAKPAGTPTSLQTGLMDWRLSLGARLDGSSAGELALRDPAWNATWSPLWQVGTVTLTGPASNDVTFSGLMPQGAYWRRQVFSNEASVDLVQLTATAYEIRFYHPSQLTGSSSPRTVSGDPFVTYKVEQGSSATSLKITRSTRTITNATTTGIAPARVEVTSITRTGSWPAFNWTVSDWTVQNGSTATEIVEQSSGTALQRTSNRKVRSPLSGATAVDASISYALQPWGDAVAAITHTTDTEILTTSTTYGTDASDAWFCQYGYPIAKTFPGGGWETYTYSVSSSPADRNRAGVITTRNRPWKSSPTAATTVYDSGEQTTYGYFEDVFGFPTRPSGGVTRVNGAITQQTSIGYTHVGVMSGTSLQLVEATRREYSNTSDYLESIVRYFREDTADAFFHKKIHSVRRADGTKTAFVYQRGYWNGAAFSLTDDAGTGTGFTSGTSMSGPVGSRISTIHGAASGGSPYTQHEGYDIDDVSLVDGKSTLVVTIRDERALVRRTETHVWKSGSWQRVAWTDYSYNFSGQLITRTASNGASDSLHYTGAMLDYEIGETGVRFDYTYDDAGRMLDLTQTAAGGIGALTTRYGYDAAGRVIEERVGAGTAESLVSTWKYDQAGRLERFTLPGRGVTTLAYNTGSRTRTVTYPTTGIRIESFELDGSLRERNGSAVVSQHFTLDVDAMGIRRGRIAWGQAGAPRFVESSSDWLGRPLQTSRPSFAGQMPYIESSTYEPGTGRLRKVSRSDTAPLLYTYDALSQPARSGLDLGGNDTLDLASSDRIAETDGFYEFAEGSWWYSQITKTYPQSNKGTALTLSTQRQRLNNFTAILPGFSGQLRDEVQTVDANGLITLVQRFVEPGTRTVKTTVTASGFVNKQIETQVNGLVTSVTGFDGLTLGRSYDGLHRPSTSTNPRTGTTTYLYHPGTTLVSAVRDSVTPNPNTVATYGYDAAGRINVVFDAAGRASRTEYNTRDQIIRRWGEGVHPVEFVYNPLGEQTEQRTFRGGTGWNSPQWPAATAGTADTTTWNLDPATGLPSERSDAAGRTVAYRYNRRGQMTSRTWARPGGITTTYGYDGDTGELRTQTYSDATPPLAYTYTRVGQLASVADSVNGVTGFVYSSDQPLQLEAIALGDFYANRALTQLYDGNKRSAGFLLGDTSRGPSADLSQNHVYDSLGRLTNLTSSSSAQGVRNIAYTYNSGGLVSGYTLGEVPFRTTRSHESNRDLLTSVESTWNSVARTRYDYTYNALSQRTTARQSGDAFADFGGSTYRRFTYNERTELINAADYLGEDPSSTAAPQLSGRHHVYAYDPIGTRVSVSRTGAAGTPDQLVANSLNQIRLRQNQFVHTAGTVAVPGIAVTVADAAGAMPVGRQGRYWNAQLPIANSEMPAKESVSVTATQTGAGANGADLVRRETRTAVAPPGNQTLVYDEDGNLKDDGLWHYEWDAENRLAAMRTSDAAIGPIPVADARRLEFRYDHMGRRIGKRVRAGRNGSDYTTILSDRRYLYDGWNVIAEFSVTSPAPLTLALIRSYTWGLDVSGSLSETGGVGSLIQTTDHATATSYLHTYDGNGNVVSLLRSNDGVAVAAYEYGPFGEVLRSEGAYAKENPFRFSTKSTDEETGLIYYGHRYYDPRNGRFISRDPLGESGGLNLYGFAGNDGVNRWDYLGLTTPDDRATNNDPGWFDRLVNWLNTRREPTSPPNAPPYETPASYRQNEMGTNRTPEGGHPGTYGSASHSIDAAVQEYDFRRLYAPGDSFLRDGRIYTIIGLEPSWDWEVTSAPLGKVLVKETSSGKVYSVPAGTPTILDQYPKLVRNIERILLFFPFKPTPGILASERSATSVGVSNTAGRIVHLVDSEIVLVGNTAKPNNFSLRQGIDTKPIGDISSPGKSASIATDLTIKTEIRQMFGRESIRGDAVSGAMVGDIRSAGFDVLHAPTPNNPLHVRIIAGERIFDDSGRNALSQAFQLLERAK